MNGLTQLLVQNDEPTNKKKCTMCGEIKSFNNFYRYKRSGLLYAQCASCNIKGSRKRRLNNKEKYALTNHKYITSEKGFINETIGGIFARAKNLNRKRRKWTPNCTKQDVYDELVLYIQDRGRICEYCKQPWTYTRSVGTVGSGHKKRGSQTDTNFSIDRLDATRTYEIGKKSNLVFCCIGCNNRKNQVRLSDIDNIQRVRVERGIK